MKYLLGIDIGTSGTKTVLFDTDGRVVATATENYPLYQPNAGWAEQDPEDWWQATLKGIRRVLDSGVAAEDVAGVGLSGQMHGLVMLDAAGEVLRKSIIWCDSRTTEQCREIEARVGKELLIEITANPALECFTAGKLLWVRAHEPDTYAKCRHILLPKDYVRYRLTGKFATEVSDASGMQMMNIGARDWSDEILKRLEIPREWLADLYESCEDTGGVTRQAALVTGLRAGTVVAGGAGDQAAAGIGNGIVEAGEASCNIGTSGVVFAHTDLPLYDRGGRLHTFCHAVPNAWHVMGVTQGAGLSMKWFKDNFYAREAAEAGDVYDEINRQIAKVSAGCEGLVYLPYLMGERTPHLDPKAKGVFYGFDARHTRAHFARAVMEGVTYSLCDCLSVIEELGIRPTRVRLAGGGSKSPLWRQMIADAFGRPCARTNSSEAGGLGVAILAGVAGGVYPDVVSAAKRMVSVRETIAPDSGATAAYAAAYRRYRAVYPAVKGLEE